MKKLISGLLAFVMFVTPAFGASTRTIEATNTEGLITSVNLVRDAGFEGLNKAGAWVASGGSLSTTTTNPGRGNVSGTWDASAASQTLKSKLVAIPAGLQGVNGVVSCIFKAASGTATHTITASDGTNDLATAATIVSSTTSYIRTTVNFIFPSSGSVQLKITSAQDEPLINIDGCILGDASNLSNVSQSKLYGAANWPATASCSWSTTSSSFGNYSADSDCTTPAGSNLIGNATAPATKIPGVTFSSLPPGDYLFVSTGSFAHNDANATACYFRYSDGTNFSKEMKNYYGTNTGISGAVLGRLSYSAAQSNVTIQLQARNDGSSTPCDVVTNVTDLNISVYYFPSSSEIAYRPSVVGSNWSGYHNGNCGFSTSSGSFADPTNSNVSCALVERSNTNFGSVSSYGGTGTSALPGIIFTPARAGKYSVTATFTASNGSGSGNGAAFQLWDGTTEVDLKDMLVTANVDAKEFTLTGQYTALSTNSVSLRIRMKNITGGTPSIGPVSSSQPAVSWSIFSIDQTLPTPVLAGSVSSSSAGQERIERWATTTTCTTGTCAGSGTPGISSVTFASTGLYNVNFTAGNFSAGPTCVAIPSGNGLVGVLTSNGLPTTSSWQIQSSSSVGGAPTLHNDAFMVICTGPR